MSDFSREEVLQVAALIMSGNPNAIGNTGWINNQLTSVVDLAEALVEEVDSRGYPGSDLSKFGLGDLGKNN